MRFCWWRDEGLGFEGVKFPGMQGGIGAALYIGPIFGGLGCRNAVCYLR